MSQPELPLEWPHHDHYTIEIRKGPLHDEETIRSHTADNPEDALDLIEGLRDTYNAREDVTWQDEEVNAAGMLYGLAPGGVVYVISVVPPLTTPLG